MGRLEHHRSADCCRRAGHVCQLHPTAIGGGPVRTAGEGTAKARAAGALSVPCRGPWGALTTPRCSPMLALSREVNMRISALGHAYLRFAAARGQSPRTAEAYSGTYQQFVAYVL